MEVDTETVQTKSIEEIEAEFKWNASNRVQLSDVISEFRNPHTVLANAQKMATIVAIDLSEANQSDLDVEAVDANMRQLLDLHAQVKSQETTLKALQGRLASNETIKDIMPAYEPLYEQNKAEYNAQSENDKYFKNQTYNNFRQSIWSVNHPDEAMPALAEAGDDDIVMGSAKISLKCPITTTWLENPVTSNNCKHTFSKAAILELLEKQKAYMCPIPGCNRRITREDLQEDEVMADRVRRAKAKAEEEHSTQQYFDVE